MDKALQLIEEAKDELNRNALDISIISLRAAIKIIELEIKKRDD